jgi:hypothetical protein
MDRFRDGHNCDCRSFRYDDVCRSRASRDQRNLEAPHRSAAHRQNCTSGQWKSVPPHLLASICDVACRRHSRRPAGSSQPEGQRRLAPLAPCRRGGRAGLEPRRKDADGGPPPFRAPFASRRAGTLVHPREDVTSSAAGLLSAPPFACLRDPLLPCLAIFDPSTRNCLSSRITRNP